MADRVACPSCGKRYPVPERLWQAGRLAVRCPHCGKRFALSLPEAEELPEVRVPTTAAEPAGEDLAPREAKPDPVPAPGSEDPALLRRRARRLARALVSELVRGREEERKKALEDGSLLLIFGEALRRAWDQYRRQLPLEGDAAAQPFKEAINEILAEGKSLF